VFASLTDPRPGVSTRHIPVASSALGTNTSTTDTGGKDVDAPERVQ
jgi:hypothetical protein